MVATTGRRECSMGKEEREKQRGAEKGSSE